MIRWSSTAMVFLLCSIAGPAESFTTPMSPPPAALPVAQKVVASADELFRMGNALSDLRRFDEAITAYGLALEQAPGNGLILANRALAYAWINRVNEATIDLNAASQTLPDQAVLHRVRAIIADRRSDEDTELAELTQSLKMEPGNPFALRFRSNIYRHRNLYQAALADADAYIRASPDEPEAYELRASVLGAERQWPRALDDAKRITEKFPREARALASAAEIYHRAGHRADAMAIMAKALTLDDSLSRLWQLRARYRAYTDVAGRQSDLDRALQLAPGDLGVVAELGVLAFDRQRYAEARDYFTQVLTKESLDYGVLTYRTMASLRTGDDADAKRDYESVIAASSGPDDLSFACRSFAEAGLAENWALSLCDKAIAKQPRNADYFANRGLVRLRLHDLGKARSDFDQAIGQDPSNATAYFGRSLVRKMNGESKGAIDDRGEALAIDPTIEEYFVDHGFVEERRS